MMGQDMLIKNLFERDIFRPINGVVKADQLDDTSVWQELDEFVVTREMYQHLDRFFSSYLDAIAHKADANIAGRIGIWVSGFFGSGKSHFIKVLSYLLRNQEVRSNGEARHAVEFFDGKIEDPLLLANIKKAVASNTDVILFNIDSKASHREGRDAILQVFLKVLNEAQGYSPDHPHIAHMERHLDEKGTLQKFREAFRRATGMDWLAERDAYEFKRDEVIEAFSEATGQSPESSAKWIDNAESNFSLTVEGFCKWVKEYLDSKGEEHRIIFMVDEIGQFIGADSHLMLNLQTIAEELGVTCHGRAWLIVTSQEDIGAVLGEVKGAKANDFSKIQGRFRTRLSLSSANVDEVIQSRLLAKEADAATELEGVFADKGDVIKNQLTFTNVGMTLKPYKDAADFARNYPFVPYQFQLMQKVFEAIRKVGASGLHLSRGERSILDAFQTAAKAVAHEEVGALVPLCRFYPCIESFLDTSVKRTIDQAADRNVEAFDIELLKVLFLIRYVEEVKGNVDNLVTLCIDAVDVDRLALRRHIEGALHRLEAETLISRSGDNYFFLTNEERDINREIKGVELTAGEEAKLLGEMIFSDVLKDQRKHRYSANKMDFDFNRVCDRHPIGNQMQNALLVSVLTPLADDYQSSQKEKCTLESAVEGGHVLIRLGESDTLDRELRRYKKTEKYLAQKSDSSLPEQTKRILRNVAEDNRERRAPINRLLSDMLVEADYYIAGQSYTVKATAPMAALDEAMDYLVTNTFSKMGLLKKLLPDDATRLKEIQSTLRINDLGQLQLNLQVNDDNAAARQDIRTYIELCSKTSRQIILFDMIQNRYAKRPYGWPEQETVLLLAQMLVMGEISLVMDAAPLHIDKAYEPLTAPAKQRKVTVIQKQTSDPKAIQDARSLGQKVFAEMGPDGEDPLFAFLQAKFKAWSESLTGCKALADTGNYPGRQEITDGLTIVKKLLADDDSVKFIGHFNAQKDALLDLAEDYHDLEHFYEHQRSVWEKLRKAHTRFELNSLELSSDATAGPALNRMKEILDAPAPYGLIKEANGLIQTVEAINTQLITDRRAEALTKIEGHMAAVEKELTDASADAALRSTCLAPLEGLRQQVNQQTSVAHITQAQQQAVAAFDTALDAIQKWLQKRAEETTPTGGEEPRPAPKPLKVIKPAELATQTYLETEADIDAFIEALRKALTAAVSDNKRIQIR